MEFMPIKVKPLSKNSGQVSLNGKSRRKHAFVDKNGNRIPNNIPLSPPKRHHSRKMTLQTRRNIVDLIMKGNFPDVASEACGVSFETFKDWMRLGHPNFIERVPDKKPYKRYVNFYRQVMRALASSEVEALNKIGMAGDRDWRAIAWMLERKNPKRWGRKTIIKKETKISARIKGEITKKILSNPEATEKALEIFETVAETTDES